MSSYVGTGIKVAKIKDVDVIRGAEYVDASIKAALYDFFIGHLF